MPPPSIRQQVAPRGWRQVDPPATVADQLRGRGVFDALTQQLAARGAIAVVLAGSWARGEAHRSSDLDMWVLGRRAGQQTLFRDGFHVHVTRTTVEAERRRFSDPRRVGPTVAGWRSAFLVYDPRRVAAKLQGEARRFRWTGIAARCDRWVAHEVTELGEEAIKLIRTVGEGSFATAAVQRNLLAHQLTILMAVHRRILWSTDEDLWERVGSRVGGAWQTAQRAALGVPRGGVVESGRAALELYRCTATAVRRTLNPGQVGAVANVVTLIDALPPSESTAAQGRGPAVLGQ
jgi:predicted nucleotidyltransferase